MNKSYLKTEEAKWHQLVLFLTPHSYHAMHLNSCPASPASRGVIYKWLSCCPREVEPLNNAQQWRI